MCTSPQESSQTYIPGSSTIDANMDPKMRALVNFSPCLTWRRDSFDVAFEPRIPITLMVMDLSVWPSRCFDHTSVMQPCSAHVPHVPA